MVVEVVGVGILNKKPRVLTIAYLFFFFFFFFLKEQPFGERVERFSFSKPVRK